MYLFLYTSGKVVTPGVWATEKYVIPNVTRPCERICGHPNMSRKSFELEGAFVGCAWYRGRIPAAVGACCCIGNIPDPCDVIIMPVCCGAIGLMVIIPGDEEPSWWFHALMSIIRSRHRVYRTPSSLQSVNTANQAGCNVAGRSVEVMMTMTTTTTTTMMMMMMVVVVVMMVMTMMVVMATVMTMTTMMMMMVVVVVMMVMTMVVVMMTMTTMVMMMMMMMMMVMVLLMMMMMTTTTMMMMMMTVVMMTMMVMMMTMIVMVVVMAVGDDDDDGCC